MQNPRLVAQIITCGLAISFAFHSRAGDLLPADPGLNGGKGNHWGGVSDKDWIDARWNNVDIGPFMSCQLSVAGKNVKKGIAIRAGETGQASVCFDALHAGITAAWTGKFIQFSGSRYGLISPPVAAGNAMFNLHGVDLWNGAKVQYRGLYLNGRHVTLSSDIDGIGVLESPWSEQDGAVIALSRSLKIDSSKMTLKYSLAGIDGAQMAIREMNGMSVAVLEKEEVVVAAVVIGTGAVLQSGENGRIVLSAGAHSSPIECKVLIWSGPKTELSGFVTLAGHSPKAENLDSLCKPAPGRWGEPLNTQGVVSKDTKPYVIDSVAVPFNNPHKALFFCSGIDFMSNGDAIISTLHGDVWRVSGLDDALERVVWHRFATGLYQPFGVKVVDDQIYVLGRDQITRLHDLNQDGEADFYENFCNQANTGSGGHDYSAGLETDSAGNFYHVDPLGLHRISKDGSRYDTIATGWRNPISLAVGPDDTINVSPQEGEWTPASQICEVKPGRFYGFGGPRVEPNRPSGYDPPLCYIPRLMDNSTGGLAWVTSQKWGPLGGHLLDLSFGQSSILLVLREVVDGETQGGVVPLNLRFPSGVIRGRIRPQDGQLYVVGTMGWATNAVKDGCLQRVRYTGAKYCIPVGMMSRTDGVRVDFSDALDRETAEDAENWGVEQWGYHYGAQYGSSDYSVAQPTTIGHDPVSVTTVKLSADGQSAFLSIANMHPVMQMRIKYRIKSATGEALRNELDCTIHKLKQIPVNN